MLASWVLALALATQVAAQAPRTTRIVRDTTSSLTPARRGTWMPQALDVWTAFARDQPLDTRFGRVRGRNLFITGLGARWPLTHQARFQIAYTADLLPLVISTGMPDYSATALSPDCRTTACPLALDAQQRQVRRTVYGIGLAPVGLEARVGLAKRVAFVTGASAGIIEFAEPVPDPAETRLNFTADASAGAELRVTRDGVIRIGYRFNHISNGGRRPTNPGMNSSMLDVGLVFLRW